MTYRAKTNGFSVVWIVEKPFVAEKKKKEDKTKQKKKALKFCQCTNS